MQTQQGHPTSELLMRGESVTSSRRLMAPAANCGLLVQSWRSSRWPSMKAMIRRPSTGSYTNARCCGAHFPFDASLAVCQAYPETYAEMASDRSAGQGTWDSLKNSVT